MDQGLAARCMAADPEARPTFDQIREELGDAECEELDNGDADDEP